MVERQNLVRVMILDTSLRILDPSRLARALQNRPLPAVREETPKEIFATELGHQVRAPPSEPPILPALTRPGDGKLSCQRGVNR